MGGVANVVKKVADPADLFKKRDLNTVSGITDTIADPMGLADKLHPSNSNNAGITGPFTLDQNQLAQDQANISAEGKNQYDATQQFIANDAATRALRTDQLGNLLTQRAADSFARTLPNIAENSQAAHLYDSSGYGQEVARQQAALGQDITSQLKETGLQDINLQSAQKATALQGLQDYKTSGLQRGLSLEDFVNQANVAKTIGAQMAPQMPSSKATGLSGGVSGATMGSKFGPWGAAAGGLAGLYLGSQSNQKGGK